MRIQKDEKQDIEFKQAWRDEYLKQVCAFANSSGGTQYIGVRDDGEVCGVEEAHKLSEDIPNKILSTMGLICPVDMLPDGDKSYFQIRVEKYPFPVSYRGKYYKRSGSTTQDGLRAGQDDFYRTGADLGQRSGSPCRGGGAG